MLHGSDKRLLQQVVDWMRQEKGRINQPRSSRQPRYLPSEEIIFRNDSGETVPAYACMKVIGAENDNGYVVIIGKPDSTTGPFLFNGGNDVADGKKGTAQKGHVVKAYYSSGTPAVGETWGPESSWNVTGQGSPCLRVYGDIESDVVFGSLDTLSWSVLVKAPAGGIPKRVGSILGSATCDLLDSDISDTGYNIIVKNWATSAVVSSGDRIGWASWYKGCWFVVSEDCSDEGSAATGGSTSSGGSLTPGFSTGSATGNSYSASNVVFDSNQDYITGVV